MELTPCRVVGCEDDFRQCENEKKTQLVAVSERNAVGPFEQPQSWISNVYPTISLPEKRWLEDYYRLLSFWEGLFQGRAVNFRECKFPRIVIALWFKRSGGCIVSTVFSILFFWEGIGGIGRCLWIPHFNETLAGFKFLALRYG